MTPDPAAAISDSSLPFVSYNLLSFNFCYYQVLISIVECSFWRECNVQKLSWSKCLVSTALFAIDDTTENSSCLFDHFADIPGLEMPDN